MPTTPEYAQLASRVYNRTPRNRTTVPTGWTELQWIPDRDLTGFSAGVYRSGSDIVISYTGTNEKKIADTVIANAPAATGLVPSAQVWEAMELYLEVARDNPGANVTFTGHSLGGGLAAMMAVFFDRRAVVFDPAPFELGARSSLALITYRAQMAVYGFSNAAFQAYANFVDTQFPVREPNVTGYWLQGEFLNAARITTTTIGTYEEVPTGPTTLTGLSGAIALHSMTTLASMLTSTAFADVVRKTPTLLAQIFDETLYARDPAVFTEPNFIDRLYVAQAGASATPLLDRFAADIAKLVASGTGTAAQPDVQKALIVAAMEYYYFKDAASTTALFTTSSNAINFKYSDIGAPSYKSLPKLVNYATKPSDPPPVPNGPEYTRGFAWVTYDAGNDGNGVHVYQINGAYANTLSGDAGNVIDGGAGDDWIRAGSGDDIVHGGNDKDDIVGLAGNDVLFGDDGDDVISGDSLDAQGYVETVPGDWHGNDILVGGGRDHTLIGGAGNESLWGDDSNLEKAFHGNDDLDGGDGNDYLDGGSGIDTLLGGADGDELYGDAGNDKLSGDLADAFVDRSTGEILIAYKGDDFHFEREGEAANDPYVRSAA